MNALEIQNLTKSYGDFTLENLNLTLPQGCILGLVGENGAGKSTTIKLILNMLQRDAGTVTVLGKDNRENTALLKDDIGVVLDEVGLPECLTVRQVNTVMKNIYRRWDEKEFSRLTAKLALVSALQRRESCGCHTREDSGEEQAPYRIIVQNTQGGFTLSKEAV